MNETEAHTKLALEAKEKAAEALMAVESVKGKCTKAEVDFNNGLSFLEVKNHTMLSYLTDLTYLMLRKSFGKKIEGDAAIERLVENRTVLEKMRPIEKKLKHQIDKSIKVAESGEIKADDPLHFKPNLKALGAMAEEPALLCAQEHF